MKLKSWSQTKVRKAKNQRFIALNKVTKSEEVAEVEEAVPVVGAAPVVEAVRKVKAKSWSQKI